MKRFLAVLISLLIVLGSMPAFAASAELSEAIYRLESFNLIDGIDPEAPVSRADAVTSLVKLITGGSPVTVGRTWFEDVPEYHPASGYVYYAQQMGYVSGVDAAHFAPDSTMTQQQFVKVAVSILGYRDVAEANGGYSSGYIGVASTIGLLKGFDFNASAEMTGEDMIILIDSMLDCNPLEPVYGSEDYKVSEDTLYEILTTNRDIMELSGVVTAVGKSALYGYAPVDDGQIAIGTQTFKFQPDDPLALLGKSVDVFYHRESSKVIPAVINIYETGENSETVWQRSDISDLTALKLTYTEADVAADKIKNIETDASFIYNGTAIDPLAVTLPATGLVRGVDNDDNKSLDVVFIDEYESFVVDRVSSVNTTLYLKDGDSYRGKSGIWFDFEDDDKTYTIVDKDGESVDFANITEGMVVSVTANTAEDIVRVVISNLTVSGTITAISSTDNQFEIDGQLYDLYAPKASALLTEFTPGTAANLALNHMNEIVGNAGDKAIDGLYGYVTGFSGSKGLDGTAKIRLIPPGTSSKDIEISAGDEIITYSYTNGEIMELTFANQLSLTRDGYAEQRITSSELTADMFYRAVICYKLNSDGEIKTAQLTKVPLYESAKLAENYAYSFNGELNSFGGYAAKDAFYVKPSTNVICVPIDANPDEEDYGVDVTISDESTYTIMPVNIDPQDQIAECAILIEAMDAASPKPIKDTDKVSVIGSKSYLIDEEGNYYYKLEVLVGNELKEAYIYEDSYNADTVAKLVCGDLIKYNTKSNGEIGNIVYLQSLAKLNADYFISRENSQNESVYAQVEDIEINRLDNLRNECVDNITLNIGKRVKSYVLLREDGPTVYSYSRRRGTISPAETEEIISAQQVGSGASEVFMLVDENDPRVVVIIED